MKIRGYASVLVMIALLGSGCSVPVLKQDIPVTTNPLGAKIFADGKPAGQTPGMVSLERNSDHILTLVKDDYRQEDVVIRKKYQSGKVLMKAIQSGVNSGLFFKDPGMAVNSGYSSISRQEESGEAFVLEPSAVKVTLTPLSGATSPVGQGPAVAPTVADDSKPEDKGLTAKDLLQAGIIAGAAVGAAQAKPAEKKWETSSSSKSSVNPDGTMVTEKSSTSVGVGVNPAGLVDALDVLLK
jgi:hypothetical protein